MMRTNTNNTKKRGDTWAAADITGLCYDYLRKLRINGGGPPYYKLGKRVVYDLGEVQSWMDQHKVVPSAANSSY